MGLHCLQMSRWVLLNINLANLRGNGLKWEIKKSVIGAWNSAERAPPCLSACFRRLKHITPSNEQALAPGGGPVYLMKLGGRGNSLEMK